MRAVTAASDHGPRERTAAGRILLTRTWSIVPAVAVVAAAAPMLITAVAISLARPVNVTDGDLAVDEIFLIRATHFAHLVGNYSRFGWDHPGPAWFYSVAPLYGALGGHSWSFEVAQLGLQAVTAALIVAVVWRWAGGLPALVTAVLLLWLCTRWAR